MKKFYITIVLTLSIFFYCGCECQFNRFSFNSTALKRVSEANEGKEISRKELMDAISTLADVKEKSAVKDLIHLMLSTNDLAIGNACLMALSEIKDPDSMDAIIQFVENKPTIMRRQGIIAARKIATVTAAGWLLANAYGHDDPIVRKEASEALSEVEQKLHGAESDQNKDAVN